MRVLDIGCGTGSLVVELARRHPDAEIFEIDPDPKALVRARRKLRRAGAGVQLDEGFSTARFLQQGPDGSMTRGVFNLERPGRVRFEYEDDVPILVVSDGEILNLIDYEVGQVTKWPVNDTPLALLVAENVNFGANVYLTAQGPGELANMIAVTARDPANPAQGSLTLMFSASPGSDDSLLGELTLRAWQVIDA